MFQVIEAVIAVTVVAELSVCKAVTVSKKKEEGLNVGACRVQRELRMCVQSYSQFETL